MRVVAEADGCIGASTASRTAVLGAPPAHPVPSRYTPLVTPRGGRCGRPLPFRIPNGGTCMRERDRVVEVSGETATFVLSGTVSPGDVSSMRLACQAIPARVRTLRLNLGDVHGMDTHVMDAVRGVV